MEDFPYKLVGAILIVAVIVKIVVTVVYQTPRYPRVDEGFYGGIPRGSGHPDCLRDMPEASQLLDMLAKGTQSDNYRELELLLSKMACLKKDLLSVSGQVNATRFQAFDTNHDRIAVAELAGMCMSKNIPSRDLDITFQTWRDRGAKLIALCAVESNVAEPMVEQAEHLFQRVWKDLYDVAQSQCIKTDLPVQNRGDVGAYEPIKGKTLKMYENTTGGFSASGWNGM